MPEELLNNINSSVTTDDQHSKLACSKPKERITIADNLRSTLLNYDLEINRAKGELNLCKTKIEKLRGDTRIKSQKNMFTQQVNERKYEAYIKRLELTKNSILETLDKILNLYTPKKKTIWMLFFISQLSLDEIATKTNYSIAQLKRIIKSMKSDLFSYQAFNYVTVGEEENE